MGVVDLMKAKRETRARIIDNAILIAIESRNLSHGDVTYETVSWLKTRAVALMGKQPTLMTGTLACELLRELHGDPKPSSRRRTLSSLLAGKKIDDFLGFPLNHERG